MSEHPYYKPVITCGPSFGHDLELNLVVTRGADWETTEQAFRKEFKNFMCKVYLLLTEDDRPVGVSGGIA